MTTQALANLIDDPETAPFILDVRAPDQFERWQIQGRVSPETVNVPYWSAIEEDEKTKALIPDGRDVVVVCAKGDSSELVVDVLGLSNMWNLEGGMTAWSTTLVPHSLRDDGTTFVWQFDRIAKACLSYAAGERGTEMAVIDPSGDIESYLRMSREMDASIRHVFDTHLHADHISLSRDLADETGAVYHLAEGDGEGADMEYVALQDDEVFELGTLKLIVRSVATPGHTPGSTSIEVDERFLVTGDAVFVSGIGRPDLGGETEPWARDLFRTIHFKLDGLDHSLDVCPAHYTSRKQAREDGTIRRRLGDLLTNDPVVSLDDEEEFVSFVVSHLGSPPAEYSEIRRVNMGWDSPNADRISELEVGRNECALTG